MHYVTQMMCSINVALGHILRDIICQVVAGMPPMNTVFLLTHTSLVCNTYCTHAHHASSNTILYFIYTHTHTRAQYLSCPSSAYLSHYQPPSTLLLSMTFELLPLLAFILPSFICPSLSLSFLFSGFLFPVYILLFLNSYIL